MWEIKKLGDKAIYLPKKYKENQNKPNYNHVNTKSLLSSIQEIGNFAFLIIGSWYICSYIYYLAIYKYYGIPVEFLELDLSKLTSPSLFILLSLLPMYITFDVLSKTFTNSNFELSDKIIVIITSSVAYFIIVLLLFELFRFFLSVQIRFTFASLIKCFTPSLYFIFYLILYDKYPKIFKTGFNVYILVTSTIFIIFGFGLLSAQKNTFPVVFENKVQTKQVVIGTFKELLIVSTYKENGKDKQLTGEIKLLDIKPKENDNKNTSKKNIHLEETYLGILLPPTKSKFLLEFWWFI